MCGITALVRTEGTAHVPGSVLSEMTDAVAHRGPDGRGEAYFSFPTDRRLRGTRADEDWCVALGHRRLSILDLSEAGAQPMCRERAAITYNGEVYNFVEVRDELREEGYSFVSDSDTEVVLAAYDRWGTDCFRRFHGMWGLCILDAANRTIVLSRDRLGIKPIYIARARGVLAIVSEIKQLRALPGLVLRPRDAAVREYLATGYEDPDATFFEGVEPLPAGTWRRVDLVTGRTLEEGSYWSPEQIRPSVSDRDEAAERFRQVFTESVRLHLRSDVPVGCALSGGLDSSAVAGTVRTIAPSAQLHTFTAEFPGASIDERPEAEMVAERLRCRAHFTEPTAQGFLRDLEAFTRAHDEPVGSLAQYAGYDVARLTRHHGVPVTLNGQGGDEVFAGYWQSYFAYLASEAKRRPLQVAGHVLSSLRGNPELLRQVPVMGRRYILRRASAGGDKVAAVLGMSTHERRVHEIRRMYLPRLLRWDDRNFMAFSVEGRYPFLDHALIETVLSFAPAVLYRAGWIKEPLRQGLQGVLPGAIARRRTKLGFETPQQRWLAGPLRGAVDGWLRADSPVFEFTSRTRLQSLARSIRWTHTLVDEVGQQLMRAFLAHQWFESFWARVDVPSSG